MFDRLIGVGEFTVGECLGDFLGFAFSHFLELVQVLAKLFAVADRLLSFFDLFFDVVDFDECLFFGFKVIAVEFVEFFCDRFDIFAGIFQALGVNLFSRLFQLLFKGFDFQFGFLFV